MTLREVLLCALVIYYARSQSLTPSTFLSNNDRLKLQTVFESVKPYQNAANLHHSILGLKLLGVLKPDESVCTKIKSWISSDIETLFHLSAAINVLPQCKVALSAENKKLLEDVIKPESSVVTLFHSFFASKNFGLAFNEKKVKDAVLESLKKDDSPISYGYAFQVAAHLTGDLGRFFDSVEDVVAQADEVNDKYLQFEGGVYITSLVIDGIYRMATTTKKMPAISDNKVLKFINYLLNRKHVHQVKSAYYLLNSLMTLSSYKLYSPVAVTLASPVAVSQSNPSIQVRVTNLIGQDLGDLTVTAESARHVKDDAIVVSRKKFQRSSTDKSLYEMNLLDIKPPRGFYRVDISVQRAGDAPRLIGNIGAVVQVKVTSQVSIESAEVGVGDSDQTVAPKTTKLQYPDKVPHTLDADYHQKVVLKFKIRDKTTSKVISAHQSFVRLVNKARGQEIIFVTESDSHQTNTFDLDVGAKGKDFSHLSGLYTMELIVGDVTIENPIQWHLADVNLTFAEDIVAKKVKSNPFSKKKEIQHMFHKQEKRPPYYVSTAFTILALSPFLILLIGWAKIGVNLGQFSTSLNAIAFHLCLTAIFVLYFLYWLKLNMFDTIRYLAVLAVPTFLFGNRLLSTLAGKKK